VVDARGTGASFGPHDPYRELFYPGGCGTDGRYARWMYESQLKDGVAGALDRLAAITGQPAATIALPPPVKPVDGPDGPALLDAAIGEHQSNADVHALMGRVPFRDDRVAGLDWEATAPAASGSAVASAGVPMLVRAGWWQAVTRWPPAGTGTQRWYLGPMARLTREAGPAGSVTHRVDITASTGATNR
jgi:predicted acyl esterase